MYYRRKFNGNKTNSETPICTAILDALLKLGFKVWRQNNHAVPIITPDGVRWKKDIYHLKGKGDISGILKDGKRLEIEVKTETGKPSPFQKEFKKMIEENNGIYILARSVDEAINELIRLNYLKRG